MQSHHNPYHDLEMTEILDKLRRPGLKLLVACLLSEEVYTKKTRRLNKSAVCRWLDWKPKKLDDKLAEMREILKAEFATEEDE